MPNLVFLLLASLLAVRRLAQDQSRSRNPPKNGRAGPRRRRCAGGTGGQLERRDPGGRARPRGRLPPDPDGRQRARTANCSNASADCAKKFAQEVGFLTASVHIRDNLELKPNAYRITPQGRGNRQRRGPPRQFMAINPGRVAGPLAGRETRPGLRPAGVRDRRRHAAGARAAATPVVDSVHRGGLHPPGTTSSSTTRPSCPDARRRSRSCSTTSVANRPALVEDLVRVAAVSAPVQRGCRTCSRKGVNIRRHAQHHRRCSPRTPTAGMPRRPSWRSRVRAALGWAILGALPGVRSPGAWTSSFRSERILMQAVGIGGGEAGDRTRPG